MTGGAEGDEVEDLTGRLLVSTPMLQDSNFDRTVVLIVASGSQGAIGVVLNRNGEVPVSEILPAWEEFAAIPPVLFAGGPVDRDTVICLARVRVGHEPTGFARLAGPIGTLDLMQDPDTVRDDLERIRLFVGYAGWGPGQLASEISEGAWLVLPGLPDDAFAPAPDSLWPTVLRRQGGTLAFLATFPPDPQQN